MSVKNVSALSESEPRVANNAAGKEKLSKGLLQSQSTQTWLGYQHDMSSSKCCFFVIPGQALFQVNKPVVLVLRL